MAQSGASTTANEKHNEAWSSQPPPYNPREVLPPIAGANAPQPAQYSSPTYNQTAQPMYQPQQQQQQQQQPVPQQHVQPVHQPQPPHQAFNQQNQAHNNQPHHNANGPGSRRGWADSSAKVCAVFQIMCGIFMFIFHIVAIVIDSNLHESGYGIWGGIFMLIAGVVGVVAANKKTTGSIVAFMVLSIIIACLCLPLLILAAIGLSQDVKGNTDYYWGFYFKHNDVDDKARAAMNGLMMMIVIIESIVAITSSALCCKAACCGQNAHSPGPNQVNVVYVGHMPYGVQQYGQQQVMFLSPQQYHMFSHQMAPQQPYGVNMSVTHGQQQSVLTQQANMHQGMRT